MVGRVSWPVRPLMSTYQPIWSITSGRTALNAPHYQVTYDFVTLGIVYKRPQSGSYFRRRSPMQGTDGPGDPSHDTTSLLPLLSCERSSLPSCRWPVPCGNLIAYLSWTASSKAAENRCEAAYWPALGELPASRVQVFLMSLYSKFPPA